MCTDFRKITHPVFSIYLRFDRITNRSQLFFIIQSLRSIQNCQVRFFQRGMFARIYCIEVCHPQEAASQSPVLMRTGHRVAPIHEQVSADAAELLAETPCLDDPQVKRPMYLVRQGAWGMVERGSGRAAELMAGTKPTAWKALGYEPHPGTLNLSVTSEARAWLEGLPGVRAPGLGRSTNYVPVTVGGGPAHVHFARSKPGPRRTVELVAPVNLRDSLALADGDMLEVRHV